MALVNRWISDRYPTADSAKLQCSEATLELVNKFPFLKRVRGHVMVQGQLRPHWWCIDPSENVADPTSHQWESPVVFYDPLDEDAEEPHGKCIYCGDLLYRSRGAESYRCENCIS